MTIENLQNVRRSWKIISKKLSENIRKYAQKNHNENEDLEMEGGRGKDY